MTFQIPLEKNAILDLDGYLGHKGLDFPVASSTVVASDSGAVVRASFHSGFGNTVVISHGDGLYTLYAHLSSFAVELGDDVLQGQGIGISGNTGTFTTGPHLHFSILQIPDHISISPTGSMFVYNADYPAFVGLTAEEIIAKAGELGLAAPGTEGTYAIGVEFEATDSGTTLDTGKLQTVAPSLVDTIPDDSSTPIHLVDDGSSDSWEFSGAIEYGRAVKDGVTVTETDWIKFSAIAGETYYIRVSGQGSDGIIALEDTLFTIRDPDNTELRVGGTGDLSHDDAIGKDAAISWTPDKSGDYFIAIGSGGSEFLHGGYQLTIERTDDTPSGVFPEGGVSETISFADAADGFGVTGGSEVAELYLESIFGTAISNVTYTGSEDAAFLVSDFEIPGVNIDLEGGILLSSGDFPGSSNTSSGFSVSHGTGGDSDLDEVASTAFSGAGTTFDASVLEFSIFIDNQDVDGIRFDIIFGSDEYPEFSNTSVIDVAAVFVNGDNKALFNGDPNTPLSVIDENLALNFVDNTSGTYPIEWDGFGALSVRPELNQGWNTIKIAVADTGDSVYDSSIYVTNFELLSDGATGDGIFKVVNGAVGQNDLAASESKEEINLAGGSGSVSGTLKELAGDVVTGFTDQIKLIIEQVNLLKEWITITFGSAILDIDEDGDGDVDGTITLEGDFEGAEFNVEVVGENTEITVEFPPENSPPVAVDDVLTVDEDQTLTGNILDDNGNGADIDPDGNDLTVSLISGPAEGILTLNDDGSFSYEADADVFDLAAPGDVIEQSFTYQIDDGNGEFDQATATISVTILDDGETISAKNGKDDVFGTDGGEDILEGGNGKDRLFGLDGADHLYGGNGKDLLDGGEGPDKLYGGNGKDTLIGGLGNDELTGGKGDDTFVFALGQGTDTVLDYGVGNDLVGLDGLIFDDISISQAGDDAALSANGELLAVLIGVDAASLSESDFFGFV